jgi:hypothetical protein
MRRATSLRDWPRSSNLKARLRRSSKRSALPFSLGIGVRPPNTYYCIIYAHIKIVADYVKTRGKFTKPASMMAAAAQRKQSLRLATT